MSDTQPTARHSAIFALGLHDGVRYILNIDTGFWHDSLPGDEMRATCGERFVQVSDDVAAKKLLSDPVAPLWCGCVNRANPPMLYYPRRMQEMVQELWEHSTEPLVRRADPVQVPTPVTHCEDDLIRQFADHCRFELGLMNSSIDLYVYNLRQWETEIGKAVDEITVDDARSWIRRRRGELADGTVKTRVTALKSFHQWGVDEGRWSLGRISLLRVRRVVERSSTPLSIEDARTLMEACETPHEHRLVDYGLWAGTRIGESAAMAAEHWRDDFLCFTGKGAKYREVPVHPELAARREILLRARPCHRSSLYKVRRRLFEKTGVWFIPHQLRKTFSSVLEDADVATDIVKDLLGHSPDMTRRVYTGQVSRRKKRESIGHLDVLMGGCHIVTPI